MNAKQTVAALVHAATMHGMRVGALVGSAGSAVINHLMGLELPQAE